MRPIFLHNWLPRVKPNINSVEVHPQLRNNGHPVDGVLVGAGGCWVTVAGMRQITFCGHRGDRGIIFQNGVFDLVRTMVMNPKNCPDNLHESVHFSNNRPTLNITSIVICPLPHQKKKKKHWHKWNLPAWRHLTYIPCNVPGQGS